MRATRLDVVVWTVLGVCALALVGMAFVKQEEGIRITARHPGDADLVSGLTQIRLQFSEALEQQSAQASLVVEPETPGRFSWREDELIFTPTRPLEPGALYTVGFLAGARGQNGGSTKEDAHWQFTVRQPSILCLSPSRGPVELWKVLTVGDELPPTALTRSDGRILDYALSPDAAQLAYTIINDRNGVDLWLMTAAGEDARLLVECGADRCNTPAWSPDGTRLAYSRSEVPVAEGARPGAPRIWTVSVASGETAPLFQDSQILGFDPKWSPDGNRIAFFDGSAGGIRILDIQSGQQEVLESQLGLVGEFSPDGSRMLFGVLSMQGNQPVTELLMADFERKEVVSIISPDSPFTDPGVPAWSPTGEWLVLNLRTNLGGPGKELWLMRPDGSDARPIVRDPAYDYGGYSWDPWGRAILFQRFPLGVADGRPEIMTWHIGDAEPRAVTSDAWWGRWLP